MADRTHEHVVDAIAWVTARLWNDVAAQHVILYAAVEASSEEREDFCYALAALARSVAQLAEASGEQPIASAALANEAHSGDRPTLMMAFQAVEAIRSGHRDIAVDIIDSYAGTPGGAAQLAQELSDVTVSYLCDLANSNGTSIYDELGRLGLIAAQSQTR